MGNESTCSAEQTQWCEVAAGFRTVIAKRLETSWQLSPKDLRALLDVAIGARSFELDCKTFDAALESHTRDLCGE